VVNPDGSLNRNIALPSTPDGLAFHATQNFMISMNTDGTITKIDLANADAISLFASSAGRHDMSTVGMDGCVYNTQDFITTYNDGTVTDESSVVRICGGFVPQLPLPLEVGKVYRLTTVCFETDNDGDGQISEDPVDDVDNDLDGLLDEDPSECPDGTDPGDIIDNDGDETYFIESVIKKNGSVANYNPGQVYAVATININAPAEQIVVMAELYDDCTLGVDDLLDLNPKNGGGRAKVIFEHGDGTLEQVFDVNTDDPKVLVFTSDEEETLLLWVHDFVAGDIVHLYVKFGPGKNSTGDGSCVNFAAGFIPGDDPFIAIDTATLVVTPKQD
jgi:hypothetical protein